MNAAQNGSSPEADRTVDGARFVQLTPATAIRSERLYWLWAGRMPRRSLVVIAGEKGLGKSLLSNAGLPALITRGQLEGELCGTPADVLIVTAEDDWASVVKPRLMAHGADLERVHRVAVRAADGDSLLTLPDDVPRLDE
jgi:KaiC/GvpD/RAD55 family RecA-like ATPase